MAVLRHGVGFWSAWTASQEVRDAHLTLSEHEDMEDCIGRRFQVCVRLQSVSRMISYMMFFNRY